MNLGQTYQEAEVKGKGKPTNGPYKFVVTKFEDTVSKKGNPMCVAYTDIESGEYKNYFEKFNIMSFFSYTTEVGAGILKGFLKAIATDNPGLLTEEEANTGNFDESKIVGCTVGGMLGVGDRGYLEIKYFDSYDKIKDKVSKEKAPKNAPEDEDLPF